MVKFENDIFDKKRFFFKILKLLVKKQVVAGINYYFTVDYLIAGPENKYYVK